MLDMLVLLLSLIYVGFAEDDYNSDLIHENFEYEECSLL